MMSTMEGPLCKWTNVMKGWQYRWFVLDDNAGLLSYYTGAVIGIDDEDDSTFTITVDGKMFHFQAHDAEERTRWVTSLEDTILRHTHRRRLKKSDQSQVPTIADFERKLTESDAYLQILINQIKSLDQRIENSTNETESEQFVAIKAKTLTLLDGVKHTIVLLQIAKNTSYPVNGVFSEFSAQSHVPEDSSLPEVSHLSIGDESLSETPNLRLRNKPLNSASEISQSNCSSVSDVHICDSEIDSVINLRPVPEVSYSSSDDDDFYYDAPEETPSISSPINKQFTNTTEAMETLNLDNSSQNNSVIDYDAMYEEEEDELGSLESHGSIISHLISQVKIGMDLTKVVLPTFILERRSLLEMYADFFAHPDLFVSITDFEAPHDRMIQVLRWYLSAFHAGRKSSIAKKPYNPVLGEVFKCYWDVPGFTSNDESKSDGPMPMVSSNNLTFIAEQVSHHPPISAFYAEHPLKRIMFSSHIWTKSKFLGLSIGVNNIGNGSVYLLDRGEEYVCNFPSAYGRSILTVPWVELGGTVKITCKQTGYSAQIEFITKPFYGGKKHRINAEVFSPPPTKKSILTVEGEWNSVMLAKWSNGHSEVFIDTRNIPIIKKQVMPIVQQECYESRNLWKDVTAALKKQDVNAATASKFAIEQQQRELVKERNEKGIKWENRSFHNLGENWNFNDPLTLRDQKAKSHH